MTEQERIEALKAAIRHAPMADGDGLCVWLDDSMHADATANIAHGPQAGRAEYDEMLERNLAAIARAALAALRADPDLAALLDASEAQRVAVRGDTLLLDWLEQNPHCQVSHEGWDDEGGWRVHQVIGNRNDREWVLIGEGQTMREAICAARAALADQAGEAGA